MPILYLVLFSCAVLICGCSNKVETTPPIVEQKTSRVFAPKDLLDEKDRNILRSIWIEDASMVAEKADDLQARQVLIFLKENNLLAEPELLGARLLEGAGSNKLWFIFLPLVVGDERIGPTFSKYASADEPAFAHFLPDQRTMILKSHVKISPLWRGIITLHEANHALEFITMGYNWKDVKTFCEKERDTHNFQNRITEKIGGEPYRKFLGELVDENKLKLKEKGFDIGVGIYRRDHHYPELESIFGPAECELERDFRETSVWIHSYFKLYEEHFATTAEDKKALFLKTLYSGSGILPR